MNLRVLQRLIFALPLVLGACGSKQPNTNSTTPAQVEPSWKNLSSNELASLIQIGSPRRQILDRLGPPDDIMEMAGPGFAVFYYFPPDGSPGERITGVKVMIRDDKVVNWSPIYGISYGVSSTAGSRSVKLIKKGLLIDSISFWIVNDAPIEGGRYVDTKLLPRLGYIGNEPDHRIRRVKGMYEAGESFEFELEDQDTEKLEAITSHTQGRKLLIMVGEVPLVAPVIAGPIRNGRFSVLLHGGNFDEVRKAVRSLSKDTRP